MDREPDIIAFATPAPLPAWKASPFGNKRYWTEERILTGLRSFISSRRGPLPCNDGAYSRLKKGHAEWPPATRVLQAFGSMARAYLAAAAAKSRVSLKNVDWTEAEDEYLLENAGRITLQAIARHLGRSYGSVHMRLGSKGHGKRARDIQCYLSAAQVAATFRIPYHRVQEFCRSGQLPAKKRLGRWEIDARDAKNNTALLAPKRTYRDRPPDVGDYYRRYGIRRRLGADGKLERYEAAS